MVPCVATGPVAVPALDIVVMVNTVANEAASANES